MKRQKHRSVLKNFKDLDRFSEMVSLNFDGNKREFRNYLGAFFTIVMLMILLAFGI